VSTLLVGQYSASDLSSEGDSDGLLDKAVSTVASRMLAAKELSGAEMGAVLRKYNAARLLERMCPASCGNWFLT
jgi:hypothetical protein